MKASNEKFLSSTRAGTVALNFKLNETIQKKQSKHPSHLFQVELREDYTISGSSRSDVVLMLIK